LISCEERDEMYDIKWSGTTEEVLSEICSILASICVELEAQPIEVIYDIVMNFLPGYPDASGNLMELMGWFNEAAEELRESERMPS